MRLSLALLILSLTLVEVAAQGSVGIELERSSLSPGEPLRIEIYKACEVTLSGPNLTEVLFSGYSDHLNLELDTSNLPLGYYEILNNCSGEVTRANFTLDELSIEASSPSPNIIEIEVYSRFLKAPVEASITVNGSAYRGPFEPPPGLLRVEANYSGLRVSEVIEVPEIVARDYYTPDNVTLIIRSQGKPKLKLISPLNAVEEIEVRRLNSTHWIASLEPRGPVALGSYEAIVSLGNLSFSRSFRVTYFYADYSYDGRSLELHLRDATTGELARGILGLRSCFWNRSFEFNGTLITEAGGPLELSFEDERGLKFETTISGISSGKHLYFPGDDVELCVAGGSFKLRSPSGRVLLEGDVGEMRSITYPLVESVELGSYSLELGNASWSFYVDSYSIDASFNGGYVEGRINYFLVPPSSLTYVLLPSNLSGETEVVGGSFRILMPEDQTSILLSCGNARVELRRCSSSLELAGVKLEANNTCLAAEERDEGIMITLRSSKGFSTVLRAEIPDGKEPLILAEDGRVIRVREEQLGDRIGFPLQDGSPSDPDGEANGLIRILLALRERSPERRVKEAGHKVKEAKLIKELKAEGSEGKWKVRIYEVNGSSAGLQGFKHARRPNTLIEEEKIGGSTDIKVNYELVRDGKILVSLDGKEGWVRVAVKLPRGAVVDEVLADNGSRKVDLWYQEGDELVFYDDPNLYYYVLYHVPPWWDPDGVNRGYDWHYRVPVQVPPTPANHVIYLDVDFSYLLSLLNVSGTFDPNSVRVVDDQGSLVPRQEFVATGPSGGRVRFVLHKDIATQTNFYVYFDISENGAKPYLNTLNAGLDSGTLSYWTYGRNPSTIGSIIGASPPGPYTVYDPYGNPNYVSDDGAPIFGPYSLVLGYRTPSGSEDSTTTGEDTWAYYEFTVPSDGGELEFWYRVESWDSANYDYFTATLRDTAGNVLATVVPNYNPNPGSSYGQFADSGWLYASYDLASYAGQTLRAHFLVHTYSDDLYKTWAYVDNLTWSKLDLTSYLNARMVEGFGVNVTSPKGKLDYGPVRVEARVDARASVLARIYDPLGNLVATARLYDDGTNGDAVANDGVYTNANAYSLTPSSPLGRWRVLVLANDSSTSTYSLSYNGLIHIPGRPYEVNYTDFFNVGESTFFFGPLSGVVFEDRSPLASKGSEDKPFAGVRVYAFKDDGDGAFDPLNDALVTWGMSGADGGYKLSLLPGSYFLMINSRELSPELNAGHSVEETWADQTYGVEWNGSAYVGTEKFGGLDPSVSDACTLEVVLHDDFETWTGWYRYGSGDVRQSNVEFYNGSYSLEKYTWNDPNGGYKQLGRTIGRGYVLQGYAFRPIPIGARSRVAVALVDGSYNGYGFIVDHRNNRVSIVRRTGGTATILSQVNYNPPEATWYFWKLILLTNNTIVFRLYDTDGTLLTQVRATDATYNSFDRVLVQGDATYYLDALVLWRLPQRCEHLAKVSTANYLGESIDFGFSYEVIVNTKDVDDAPTELRFAQGSLRQFILNSNAIYGMQKSHFRIPKTDSGYVQENMPSGDKIDVWRIVLSSELPVVTDPVNLTARTQPGSSSLIEGSYVGCDNYRIPDFETPRVELYGNGYTVFNLSAKYAQLEGFSVYMTPYAVFAVGSDNRYLIRDNFIGAYANGTDAPKVFFGVSIGKYGVPVIYRNLSAVVKHNIIARALHYGVVVNSGNIANATIEENWVRGCGIEYSVGDGMSLQTNGNLVLHNLIEGNSNNGDNSVMDGGAGIELIVWAVEQSEGLNKVINNSILNNGRWGVSVLSTYTKADISGNSISGNGIGIIVSHTSVANITGNCIFNNSRVGIDLDTSGNPNGDDVTPNDGQIDPSHPNNGIDYPVITSALLLDDQLYLEGFIGREDVGGSPNFGGALVEIYLVRNSTKGDDLLGNNLSQGGQLPKSYGEGWIYLGRLLANANGYFSGSLDVSGKGVDPGSLITATATLNGTSEFGPNAPVMRRRNLSASIRVDGMEATVSVTAHEFRHHNVIVYWVKPENMSVVSMSGDYNQWGTVGDVYWWRFNKIEAGETKHVYLTFSSSGEYRLLDALMLGLDPPTGSLSLEVREFSTITFYPNGTHRVSRLWGFLTLNNTSPDPISSLELYLDAPGYVFYLDYPAPSSEPDALPLNYSYLAPLSYVRWRYEAPASEAMVPLEIRERNLSCGVEVIVSARDDVRDVRVRKLGEVWEIGDMRRGESRSRTFSVSGCVSEVASIEFRYANASLLTKLRGLRGVSDAEVDVIKELAGSTARARATFRNRASSLIYNLTEICIMRSPTGPVLYCESPGVILKPGEAYETAYFSETVGSIPVYYANASFTMVPSMAGSTVPLRSLASGLHVAVASLPETVCCIAPPPTVTTSPTAVTTTIVGATRPTTTAAVPTAPAATRTETTLTTPAPTETAPVTTTPWVPINITVPPEVRRLPLPFLMSLGLPLMIALLMMRRRTSLVVSDYRTLRILREEGRLQDLARIFRVAITDLTLLMALGDEDLLRAIVSLGPDIHITESEDIELISSLAPPGVDLDTLLARELARRLRVSFLPDLLLGR